MLSVNPDAATRDDVARLAAELMEAQYLLWRWVNICGGAHAAAGVHADTKQHLAESRQ